MIYYETVCFSCKKTFKIVEGTKKYKFYKENMNGKFSCDKCEEKIYQEARKNLFSKL